MIEDHDLVDHGQLQMRVRVIEGDPRVLRQQDDEPTEQDQDERGPGRRPVGRDRIA